MTVWQYAIRDVRRAFTVGSGVGFVVGLVMVRKFR